MTVRIVLRQEIFGIGVGIIQETDGRRAILRLNSDHVSGQATSSWAPLSEIGVEVAPTVLLDDDVCRALLDALTRHYEGASDMHALVEIYHHERERRDGMEDVIKQIAGGRFS